MDRNTIRRTTERLESNNHNLVFNLQFIGSFDAGKTCLSKKLFVDNSTEIGDY